MVHGKMHGYETARGPVADILKHLVTTPEWSLRPAHWLEEHGQNAVIMIRGAMEGELTRHVVQWGRLKPRTACASEGFSLVLRVVVLQGPN